MSPIGRALLLLLWPAVAMFSAPTPAPVARTLAPVAQTPIPVTSPRYHTETVVAATITKQFQPAQIAILEKLNRRDLEHLIRLKEMIVPDAWLDDELLYSPLPATWAWAESMPKVLIVSQPAQVFGAYESGRLVYWGPVSSGRKDTPTPAGVFNLTWKAKSRRSTDNENWLLEWYFNFINARGVSFHKFELPGLPASHACVRLLERDAKWVYAWGEQWKLSANGREVVQPGSTIVVLGTYDFDRPAPWLSPDWWRTLMALPADPTKGAINGSRAAEQ
jgi:lipoprotein-anchoring transpeptidase ErfK/SrfK